MEICNIPNGKQKQRRETKIFPAVFICYVHMQGGGSGRRGRLKRQKKGILEKVLGFAQGVEKNDEDQKIEQDGIKPEDKAHKAATKIQASFRGHITRKKLKGEKKGDAQAAEAEAKEKDEAPVADGLEKKEGEGATPSEAAPASGPKPEEPGKAGETPSEEKKGEGAPDAATEQGAPQAPAPSEEKAGSAETESATKASTDNSPSSKAEDAPAKEEPKQADVPAAVTAAAAAATTPAAEDAAAKATAQPPTDAAESSQAEEKIGEPPPGPCLGWVGPRGHQGTGRTSRRVFFFQEIKGSCVSFPKAAGLRANSGHLHSPVSPRPRRKSDGSM
uniref:Neuromodulin n=1 Tax=Canis lupus familiaris TaxID=9615 RepID=A0A8P0SFM9_CANLF